MNSKDNKSYLIEIFDVYDEELVKLSIWAYFECRVHVEVTTIFCNIPYDATDDRLRRENTICKSVTYVHFAEKLC